jgi:hypothetical protein
MFRVNAFNYEANSHKSDDVEYFLRQKCGITVRRVDIDVDADRIFLSESASHT